jgi:hypothetical protein
LHLVPSEIVTFSGDPGTFPPLPKMDHQRISHFSGTLISEETESDLVPVLTVTAKDGLVTEASSATPDLEKGEWSWLGSRTKAGTPLKDLVSIMPTEFRVRDEEGRSGVDFGSKQVQAAFTGFVHVIRDSSIIRQTLIVCVVKGRVKYAEYSEVE